MMYRNILRTASLCGVATMLLTTMLLAMADEAEACSFLDGLFGCGRQPACPAPIGPSMCPPTVSPGCAPCGQQTVQYSRQTAYRAFYPRVPVRFTYPVTTWTHMAPFATNRVVYQNQCGTSCGTCGCAATGTYGAVGGGCASCQSVGGGIPTPAESTPPPETFRQELQQPQTAPQTPEQPIQPVPNPSAARYAPPMPRLITPENRVPIRSTSREVRPIVHFQTISRTPQPVSSYRAPINDGGWRASSH